MGINIPDPLDKFIFRPNQAHSLPSFYWNVYTDEQRVKYLCCLIHALSEKQNEYITNNNLLNDAMQELNALFEQFQESGFDDYYRAQIEQWIEEHPTLLFERFAKMIFFGLTDDGHFCAYVPESWADIQFDTGMVYGNFDYGRLILRYNVDGSGVIDNTGRYDDTNTESLLYRITRLENTLYTFLSEGGE